MVTLATIPCSIIERSGTTFMVVDADGNHVATVSGYETAEQVCNAVNFWVAHNRIQAEA